MKPVFMKYTKADIVNFVVLLVIGFLVIPNVITTDYWYTSILIPWLCLTLAAWVKILLWDIPDNYRWEQQALCAREPTHVTI